MRRRALIMLFAVMASLATPVTAQAAPITELLRVPGIAFGHDETTGRLVVTADETVSEPALRRIAARGAEVVRTHGRLSTLIMAGQMIFGENGMRCSVGANARRGTVRVIITAGHCAETVVNWYSDPTRSKLIGTRDLSSFPNNDYGLIRYLSTVASHNAIYTYPGSIAVTGAGNPYVGQSVCRSGATTGVRCGSVTALNQTVTYPEGTVYGLIRTNICSEPGDSGGPIYVPSTGVIVAIVSGGSGNCTVGGTTYAQPIMEIISAYGLTIP